MGSWCLVEVGSRYSEARRLFEDVFPCSTAIWCERLELFQNSRRVLERAPVDLERSLRFPRQIVQFTPLCRLEHAYNPSRLYVGW